MARIYDMKDRRELKVSFSTRVMLWFRQLFRRKRTPIFTIQNTIRNKVVVKDVSGNVIPNVIWYDTNTREAEFFVSTTLKGCLVTVSTNYGRKALKVRVRLPGSRIIVDDKVF